MKKKEKEKGKKDAQYVHHLWYLQKQANSHVMNEKTVRPH
jgi:hypothetical protein